MRRTINKYFLWVFHPITVFVLILLGIFGTLAIIITWFAEYQSDISQLPEFFTKKYFDNDYPFWFIAFGIAFIVEVLIGTIFLFVVYIKQKNLMKRQRIFLSSVTHELRSPLSSISLCLESFKSAKHSEEIKDKMIDIINKDCDRLKTLVNQILVSARLDKGLINFDNFSRVNLDALVRETIAKLNYLDPNLASRVAITSPKPLIAYAPREALELLFENIIQNAVKYSKKDTPIEVKIDIDENGYLICQFKDSGQGIDKKDIKHIFKLFYRSSSAERKSIKGTGLGLFIVQTIVKNLHGKVWVESKGENQGSTFFISLPKLKLLTE